MDFTLNEIFFVAQGLHRIHSCCLAELNRSDARITLRTSRLQIIEPRNLPSCSAPVANVTR
ncbi:hypothetical protein NC651_033507 [Populus alba x Populus x berolinensis]|nr:hypothetical protein NC651_033507 [Populus alba x Populus x berolinensis]